MNTDIIKQPRALNAPDVNPLSLLLGSSVLVLLFGLEIPYSHFLLFFLWGLVLLFKLMQLQICSASLCHDGGGAREKSTLPQALLGIMEEQSKAAQILYLRQSMNRPAFKGLALSFCLYAALHFNQPFLTQTGILMTGYAFMLGFIYAHEKKQFSGFLRLAFFLFVLMLGINFMRADFSTHTINKALIPSSLFYIQGLIMTFVFLRRLCRKDHKMHYAVLGLFVLSALALCDFYLLRSDITLALWLCASCILGILWVKCQRRTPKIYRIYQP